MRKKKVEIKTHKHIDEKGYSFGRLHPLDVVHKNIKTQTYHDLTVLHERSIQK